MLNVLNHPAMFYLDPVQLEPNQNKLVQDERVPAAVRIIDLLQPGPCQSDRCITI